jgi:hypothetical protein
MPRGLETILTLNELPIISTDPSAEGGNTKGLQYLCTTSNPHWLTTEYIDTAAIHRKQPKTQKYEF